MLDVSRLKARSLLVVRAVREDAEENTFALAVDLPLADGRMSDREKAFIDELQEVLHIDDDTAAKIVEVLLIENRGGRS